MYIESNRKLKGSFLLYHQSRPAGYRTRTLHPHGQKSSRVHLPYDLQAMQNLPSKQNYPPILQYQQGPPVEEEALTLRVAALLQAELAPLAPGPVALLQQGKPFRARAPKLDQPVNLLALPGLLEQALVLAEE